MEIAVLERVALEEECIVAVSGAELDRRDPAIEGEVEDRAQAGVPALDHQEGARSHSVEDPLPRLDAFDPVVQRGRESRTDIRILELDARLETCANDRRQSLASDACATVLVRLEVVQRVAASECRLRLATPVAPDAGVVLPEHEAAEAE